jgi:hypothetical protein
VRDVEQLKVIQIRKRKPEKKEEEVIEVNDRVTERIFWFVIGFSVALMICCIAFGQTINA